MTEDDLDVALRDLTAESETARLNAARRLATTTGSELPPRVDTAVREALAREAVPWVRGALADVLAGAGAALEVGIKITAPRWDERLEDLHPDVARHVINLSTKRVLHEVAAVVGRAKLAAGADMSTAYSGSETERQLDFLSEVCAGLRTLTAATQAPSPDEFDLSEEISALAKSMAADLLCPILANGPSPFVVQTDRALLRLAVQNILINAVEATLAVGPIDKSRAVVVTWGIAPHGAHVTIIDRGPGPPAFLAQLPKSGVSTKRGHPGYGLATASEAMRSLDGTVEIQRNDRGGATVVVSWKDG